MDIFIYIIVGVVFGLIGFLLGKRNKPSGRLVINEQADEIFVALTDKPEDLKKKHYIHLKVYQAHMGGKQ